MDPFFKFSAVCYWVLTECGIYRGIQRGQPNSQGDGIEQMMGILECKEHMFLRFLRPFCFVLFWIVTESLPFSFKLIGLSPLFH